MDAGRTKRLFEGRSKLGGALWTMARRAERLGRHGAAHLGNQARGRERESVVGLGMVEIDQELAAYLLEEPELPIGLGGQRLAEAPERVRDVPHALDLGKIHGIDDRRREA